MTSGEFVDKLDTAIRDFEKAQARVEAAQASLQDVSQKLRDLIGTTSKSLPEIKTLAHEKIGVLLLEERRKGL